MLLFAGVSTATPAMADPASGPREHAAGSMVLAAVGAGQAATGSAASVLVRLDAALAWGMASVAATAALSLLLGVAIGLRRGGTQRASRSSRVGERRGTRPGGSVAADRAQGDPVASRRPAAISREAGAARAERGAQLQRRLDRLAQSVQQSAMAAERMRAAASHLGLAARLAAAAEADVGQAPLAQVADDLATLAAKVAGLRAQSIALSLELLETRGETRSVTSLAGSISETVDALARGHDALLTRLAIEAATRHAQTVDRLEAIARAGDALGDLADTLGRKVQAWSVVLADLSDTFRSRETRPRSDSSPAAAGCSNADVEAASRGDVRGTGADNAPESASLTGRTD